LPETTLWPQKRSEATWGGARKWSYVKYRCLQPYQKEGHMRTGMKEKVIRICEAKIMTKDGNVGLSFYAFFANKNDDPELLMEVAH
jgi:hypothetical protein